MNEIIHLDSDQEPRISTAKLAEGFGIDLLGNMTEFLNYHSYAYPDEKHQKMLRDNGFPLMHEGELHDEFTRRKFAVAMSSPKGIATIEDVLSPLVIKTKEAKSHSFVNGMVEFLIHKITK